MKKIFIAVMALMAVSPFAVKAQLPVEKNVNEEFQLLQGIGPVVSGSVEYSQLPEKVQIYLSSNFGNAKIKSIEKEFASGSYDVTLDNGVELDFNKNGELTEIEGLNAPVPYPVVAKILPGPAVKTLEGKSLHKAVESIEIDNGSYEVEFVKSLTFNLKKMKFDSMGNPRAVE